MLSPGYMAPLNFFASAGQGGRVMGRLLLMYEEKLLSFWMKFTFTVMAIFIGECPPTHISAYLPTSPHIIP